MRTLLINKKKHIYFAFLDSSLPLEGVVESSEQSIYKFSDSFNFLAYKVALISFNFDFLKK